MRRVLLTTLPLLLILSCGSSTSSKGQGDATNNNAAGTAPAVQSTGWSQISMIANWAKTSLDGTGHFTTSRNACGQEADGAVDLATWNRIATAVNAAVVEINRVQNRPAPSPTPSASPTTSASSGGTDDHCFDAPRSTKMDGIAEVTLGDSPNGPKQTLIDARGMKLCTKFDNEQVALQLFDALSTVTDAADKENCPNGWGSN